MMTLKHYYINTVNGMIKSVKMGRLLYHLNGGVIQHNSLTVQYFSKQIS